MDSTFNNLHSLEVLEFLDNSERRKRKVRRRKTPMEEDEIDFHKRYRLTKGSVLELLKLIDYRIKPNTSMNNALSLEQLLLTLRFFATGAHQLVLGDLAGVSQPTVSRIISRVSDAIASLRPEFINMPDTEEECLQVSEDFFKISQFPSLIGCIDCTHVPIVSPGGTDAERFRNRNGIFSLNVQTIVSADLAVRHVVARWPGSVDDSTIFNNSTIPEFMVSPVLQKYHLLGDSGYPCTSFLMTPLSQPTLTAEIQ